MSDSLINALEQTVIDYLVAGKERLDNVAGLKTAEALMAYDKAKEDALGRIQNILAVYKSTALGLLNDVRQAIAGNAAALDAEAKYGPMEPLGAPASNGHAAEELVKQFFDRPDLVPEAVRAEGTCRTDPDTGELEITVERVSPVRQAQEQYAQANAESDKMEDAILRRDDETSELQAALAELTVEEVTAAANPPQESLLQEGAAEVGKAMSTCFDPPAPKTRRKGGRKS